MKKALIIANMLFASATVFGMKSSRDVSQESRKNSMRLQADNDYELIEELQEQEAIYDSLRMLQLEDNNQSEKEYQLQQAEEAELQRIFAESKKEAEEQKAPAESEEAELQRVKENSLFTLVTDAKNREALERGITESKEEYQLQQAIAESKRKADSKEKKKAGKGISKFLQKAIEIENIELEEPFNQKISDNFISNASISDDLKVQYLSNIGFMNPGDYTLRTLTILRNQSEYKFMQRDHGSLFNKLNSQCPILALGVDKTTRIRLQQQKAFGKNTTLGKYMHKTGGLDPYDYDNWEAIAKALGRRIDIWVFPGQGKDDVDEAFYHVGGQLNMILSYGVNLGNNVKRLRFDSAYDPNSDMSSRVAGHYTELRVFNKDGSQVK